MTFTITRVVPRSQQAEGQRKYGVVTDVPMLLSEARRLVDRINVIADISPDTIKALAHDLNELERSVELIVSKYPDDVLVQDLINFKQVYWPAAREIVTLAGKVTGS
jgi:hypothetical protein